MKPIPPCSPFNHTIYKRNIMASVRLLYSSLYLTLLWSLLICDMCVYQVKISFSETSTVKYGSFFYLYIPIAHITKLLEDRALSVIQSHINMIFVTLRLHLCMIPNLLFLLTSATNSFAIQMLTDHVRYMECGYFSNI